MTLSSEHLFDLELQAGSSDRQYWKDLWTYRELLYFLARRDLLVRYKQTAIGVAWSVLRPLLTVIIFTLVFGRLAKLPSSGMPYALLVLTGLLPWQFFSNTLSDASGSLINNSSMISKVYFPRLCVPISTIFVNLVDLLISFGILLVLMVWYGVVPTWRLLLLPLLVLYVALTAIGAGVWLAALNVKYRDFRYALPFVVQLGLYISPVGFSSGLVPDKWRLLYACNPMVGAIDGFRWAILGDTAQPYGPGMLVSVVVVVLLLVGGIRHFRKTEKTFADLI